MLKRNSFKIFYLLSVIIFSLFGFSSCQKKYSFDTFKVEIKNEIITDDRIIDNYQDFILFKNNSSAELKKCDESYFENNSLLVMELNDLEKIQYIGVKDDIILINITQFDYSKQTYDKRFWHFIEIPKNYLNSLNYYVIRYQSEVYNLEHLGYSDDIFARKTFNYNNFGFMGNEIKKAPSLP